MAKAVQEKSNSVKKVPVYCFQWVSGPDLPTVKTGNGVTTEVAPNFKAAEVHPGGGKAEELNMTPGIDPEVTPACVNSCIAGAMHFGDMHDPESNVSKLVEENSTFRMHAELGTDPGTYYILAGPEGPDEET